LSLIVVVGLIGHASAGAREHVRAADQGPVYAVALKAFLAHKSSQYPLAEGSVQYAFLKEDDIERLNPYVSIQPQNGAARDELFNEADVNQSIEARVRGPSDPEDAARLYRTAGDETMVWNSASPSPQCDHHVSLSS